MSRMRWLVGFDLTPNSVGVVRLARWLHAQGQHLVHGVHVQTDASTGLRDSPGAGPALEEAQQRARAYLEHYGVLDAFASVEAVHGAPDKVLPALAKERGFDGLLLGRARAERFSLVSLGRVPRRVLRGLALPTIVVPPELDEVALGQGPLVVALAPVPESLPAVRFAERLGDSLGLSVMLVHAMAREVPVPVFGALELEPRDPGMKTSDIVPPQDTSAPEEIVTQWVDRHGLQLLPLELRRGPAPAVLRDAAREHEATMIVCGSRRLSLAERLFTSSVGSDLAAHSGRPVVVVPAPEPTE